MTDTSAVPEGGPCPPLKEPSEAEQVDNTLVNETAANYNVEEKDEETA